METIVNVLLITAAQAAELNEATRAEKARMAAAGINDNPARVEGVLIPLNAQPAIHRGKYYVGVAVLNSPDLAYMNGRLRMLERAQIDLRAIHPDRTYDEFGNWVQE